MADLDLDAIERHARAAEGHTEWVADILALVAEVRRLRAALADRQTMAAVYGYELAHDEMPDHDQRVRRDAAADALAHAADLIGRHHGDQHGLRISEHVDRWAAEVRAGTRTIPESTGTVDDPPTRGE